jgi:hypothetical protein
VVGALMTNQNLKYQDHRCKCSNSKEGLPFLFQPRHFQLGHVLVESWKLYLGEGKIFFSTFGAFEKSI